MCVNVRVCSKIKYERAQCASGHEREKIAFVCLLMNARTRGKNSLLNPFVLIDAAGN